ncbi:aminotransferase class I/II-fold pyridoxal phosphate-dependent enzyme [Kitasatospora sp. RG8]|uniref:aminotransferase class I/II-fold pyridoxal phosphate-dependent enzyme n=1 Tax=Kitasatospora sp. RG8 TaxID=2820815 RepID=UPI001ADFBD06|nr:aminotransferase class I/II-fold pyridoxal phosphate-dependent enzyme [Kitasatospora sp. RG8]MBP0451476.1 aminotransferase class I/II-fold pyridoxal phosphate-dependent enzyme [Kitasatospora sp. RG8]
MAAVPYQSSADTAERLIAEAMRQGTSHLTTGLDEPPGTFLRIGGRDLLNFGTCGYLALEQDERIQRGAVDAIARFGMQFSVSRSYVASGLNLELEELLGEMYEGHPVLVYSSTSLCHISVLPALLGAGDHAVLDQQVHFSVQTAAQLVRHQGVELAMVRHGDLDALRRRLRRSQASGERVWYLIDGVYSMFGDVAPVEELARLMEEYPALHLYVDDAHGMSWYGRHGTGYVFERLGRRLGGRVVLVTTLAKGFGTIGGVAVFPTGEAYEKVRINGGPLMYSHPLPPPMLGAAIASARIHLSARIGELQAELAERREYCNGLLAAAGLPVVSDPRTPVYYLGLGEPEVSYAMVRRMLDEGFYVNQSSFPVVPLKKSGLRFTLTRHVGRDHIRALVEALAHHLPRALHETGRTTADVRSAFGRMLPGAGPEPAPEAGAAATRAG